MPNSVLIYESIKNYIKNAKLGWHGLRVEKGVCKRKFKLIF
jgi:hypothetical protein